MLWERRVERRLDTVLTDVLYAQLVELSHFVGGQEYDCLLCQPHHNYWNLEMLGYVTITDRDHPNDHIKVARLTATGQNYLGGTSVRRRRRRRRLYC